MLLILEMDESTQARCVQGVGKPWSPTLMLVFTLTLQVLALATDATSSAAISSLGVMFIALLSIILLSVALIVGLPGNSFVVWSILRGRRHLGVWTSWLPPVSLCLWSQHVRQRPADHGHESGPLAGGGPPLCVPEVSYQGRCLVGAGGHLGDVPSAGHARHRVPHGDLDTQQLEPAVLPKVPQRSSQGFPSDLRGPHRLPAALLGSGGQLFRHRPQAAGPALPPQPPHGPPGGAHHPGLRRVLAALPRGEPGRGGPVAGRWGCGAGRETAASSPLCVHRTGLPEQQRESRAVCVCRRRPAALGRRGLRRQAVGGHRLRSVQHPPRGHPLPDGEGCPPHSRDWHHGEPHCLHQPSPMRRTELGLGGGGGGAAVGGRSAFLQAECPHVGLTQFCTLRRRMPVGWSGRGGRGGAGEGPVKAWGSFAIKTEASNWVNSVCGACV